jgi:hypothetical protein
MAGQPENSEYQPVEAVQAQNIGGSNQIEAHQDIDTSPKAAPYNATKPAIVSPLSNVSKYVRWASYFLLVTIWLFIPYDMRQLGSNSLTALPAVIAVRAVFSLICIIQLTLPIRRRFIRKNYCKRVYN